MMLSACSALIVTIDFGSTVQIGEEIPATTPGFSLDVPAIGSPEFDLICLASTLLYLTGESLKEIGSRQRLMIKFSESSDFVHRAAYWLCKSAGDVDLAISSSTALIEDFNLEVLRDAFPTAK